MSTTMFNFQMSKFLCYLKSSEYDPFYPSIKLDFFNAYYLQMFMYHHEITYKRMLVKECEQNLFSELKLSTKWSSEKPSQYLQPNCFYFDAIVSQMMNTLDDDRFDTEELTCYDSFENYVSDTVEETESITITPQFLDHFDIRGISDSKVLNWIVNYQSIQLGFYFISYGSHLPHNKY